MLHVAVIQELKKCFSYRYIYWYLYIDILNHSINFKSSDAIISISTLGRVHFWIYLLIVNFLVMKPSQLIDLVMANVFRKIIGLFVVVAPMSRISLTCQPTAINQKPVMMSFYFFNFFEGMHWEIKRSKYHVLNINRSHCIAILLRIIELKTIWKHLHYYLTKLYFGTKVLKKQLKM